MASTRPDALATASARDMPPLADPLEQTMARRAAGAIEDACRLADDALGALRRRHGIQSAPVASALLVVGALDQDVGRHDAAEQAFHQARPVAAELADAALRVDTQLALANLRRIQGRYPEAETLLTTTLRLAEDTCGPDALEVADVCNALAIMYKYTGRFDAAQGLYRRTHHHRTDPRARPSRCGHDLPQWTPSGDTTRPKRCSAAPWQCSSASSAPNTMR